MGLTDPDPSINKQTKCENIYFYSFVTLDTGNLLSLKTDGNVLTESVEKKLKKNLFLVGILKATEEKNRIRISNVVVRTSGSGSVSKCIDLEHWQHHY